MIDIFSRFVVGWSLVRRSNAKVAEYFVSEIVEREGIEPGQVTIHNDRGTEMTAAETFCSHLDALGITRSLSRPQVSDDIPFSEVFKTLKYHRDFPDRFGSFEDAKRTSRSGTGRDLRLAHELRCSDTRHGRRHSLQHTV
jgi:putative transposase